MKMHSQAATTNTTQVPTIACSLTVMRAPTDVKKPPWMAFTGAVLRYINYRCLPPFVRMVDN